MLVAHYSKNCIDIMNSQVIFMTYKFGDDDDLILDFDTFMNAVKELKLDKIKYKQLLPRDKFEKILSQKSVDHRYSNIDENIYGFCVTTGHPSKHFEKIYGSEYIEFDIDSINKINTGFLFVHNVVYTLKNIETYLYELCYKIYNLGEATTRKALELSEDDMPDNYELIFSRLFYYLKILYKDESKSFENEIRVFLDETKIESGTVDMFQGAGFNYGHAINSRDLKKYIVFPKEPKSCKKRMYMLRIESFNVVQRRQTERDL